MSNFFHRILYEFISAFNINVIILMFFNFWNFPDFYTVTLIPNKFNIQLKNISAFAYYFTVIKFSKIKCRVELITFHNQKSGMSINQGFINTVQLNFPLHKNYTYLIIPPCCVDVIVAIMLP